MDVAGLVIGLATAWKTCIEVFDIVDASRSYGMDYELFLVKLEVERIRLLTWGDTVGLAEIQRGGASSDSRFNREDVRTTVLRLLGCIQHIFENSDKLQERYGLQPVVATPAMVTAASDDDSQPTQSRRILGAVFKHAYETLRKSAKDRQRDTPLKRKTLWAVHDKKKFQLLVTEIKGFNDSLESLFPDVKLRTLATISAEIRQSEDIHALQSLQEATSEDHEEISETASVRLVTLGATLATRSVARSTRLVTEGDEGTEHGEGESAGDTAGESATDGAENKEIVKLMREVEEVISKRGDGALNLNVHRPDRYSAHASAYVLWDGDKRDDNWPSHWAEEKKGFISLNHASFGRRWALAW
jgi:hypothetical protein